MRTTTRIITSILSVIVVILFSWLGLKYYIAHFMPQIHPSGWAFEAINTNKLNKLGYYGKNITIGVVDTGIDLEHEDLDHIKLVAWKDFINNKTYPYDDDGHGTAIAGVISSKGKLKGVAPEARLIFAKAIKSGGSGKRKKIAEAIRFCADPNKDGNLSDGADVISLSLGSGGRTPFGTEIEDAVEWVIEQGIVVIAAAGNDGEHDDGDVESPATVELTIAAGAIDKHKRIASFSSRGDNDGTTPLPWDDRRNPNKKPELVAPGVKILSTGIDGTYIYGWGTSYSTAFVAGAVALVLDAYPQYRHRSNNGSSTVEFIKKIFMQTANPCDEQQLPHDDWYGYGLVDAFSAYQELLKRNT